MTNISQFDALVDPTEAQKRKVTWGAGWKESALRLRESWEGMLEESPNIPTKSRASRKV